MTLEAVRLAAEKDQPFAKVYGQQWVLTERAPGPLPGFREVALGRWSLWHGPGLDVASAHDRDRAIAVAVMGQAVDLEGRYMTDAVLSELVSSVADAAGLAEKLTMLGGRYAFVVSAHGFERVYLDPSGCLGAVFDANARRVAATLFLALDRPVEPDRSFIFQEMAANGSGGRHAFGMTADARARRLLANHYLDLESFTQVRHWPLPGCDFTCPMTPEAIERRLDVVIERQRTIIRALTGAVRPAMLPLSGGDDSRLLLALSAGMLERYDLFFAHRANSIGARDVAIARELAARMGIDLTVIDAVEDESVRRTPRFARRMNVRRRLAMGLLDGGPDEKKAEIEVRMALPIGGAVLRGNVTDVSKAVLWRPVGIREFLRTGGAAHDPVVGVRLMMLGPDRAEDDADCLAAYADWAETLPPGARCRTIDFASIEHFRTHGQGAFFYAADRNFYQTPSADRTILEALISIPPHLRDAFHINDLIVGRMAPELSGVGFTRATANEMRENRPPLADVLEGGPARL